MATFKIYGVQAQAIVLEEDDAGNITGQHVLPAELLLWPHGLNLEAYIQRKLLELQPKEEKPNDRR